METVTEKKNQKFNKEFFTNKSILVFDIETNGINNFITLDGLKTIHCISIKDFWTGENIGYKPNQIEEALDRLREADYIVGHNIIGFDIPAIKKMYPKWRHKGVPIDTKLLGQLIIPDIIERDMKVINKGLMEFKTKTRKLKSWQMEQYRKLKKPEQRKKFLSNLIFPSHLIGKYSLESWGFRIGELKQTSFKSANCWDKFTNEMLYYCKQDVEVTDRLLRNFISEKYCTSVAAFELEHQFAAIIHEQERCGVVFDVDRAKKLEDYLTKEFLILENKLRNEFLVAIKPVSAKELVIPFVPKKDNKAKGYKAGCEVTRIKYVPFTPSPMQIAERLIKKYKDNPKYKADIEYLAAYQEEKENKEEGSKNVLKLDEDALVKLTFPEIPLLVDYLTIRKRLGQLTSGKQALLKAVLSDGRIHGTVNTAGTVSGRCSHTSPNLGQVPTKDAKWGGAEFRACFIPSKGMKQVGADAAALEFRCFAHAVRNKELVETVCNGKKEDGTDIHTVNMRLLELSPEVDSTGQGGRDKAKTFIYAFIYGGGDAKLGSIVGKGAAAGKELRAVFLKNLTGLDPLLKKIKEILSKQNYLTGLDGRKLKVRQEYAAINLLLQSAGALIMKRCLITLDRILKEKGYKKGIDFNFILNIHDEIQAEVRPEIVEDYSISCKEAMKEAEVYFKFFCPLEIDVKEGDNWLDTH